MKVNMAQSVELSLHGLAESEGEGSTGQGYCFFCSQHHHQTFVPELPRLYATDEQNHTICAARESPAIAGVGCTRVWVPAFAHRFARAVAVAVAMQ